MPKARSEANDRILDAAETVFAQKGYRGGALNDVAVSAGYTRPGLLHYYPSKEALLLAILERRDERMHALETVEDGYSLFDIFNRIDSDASEALDNRVLIELGHIVTAEAASREHPAHDWSVGRERKLRVDLVGAIERSKQRGELRSDVDSNALGALILAAYEGLESLWLLDDQVDVPASMNALRQVLEAYRPQ